MVWFPIRLRALMLFAACGMVSGYAAAEINRSIESTVQKSCTLAVGDETFIIEARIRGDVARFMQTDGARFNALNVRLYRRGTATSTLLAKC